MKSRFVNSVGLKLNIEVKKQNKKNNNLCIHHSYRAMGNLGIADIQIDGYKYGENIGP